MSPGFVPAPCCAQRHENKSCARPQTAHAPEAKCMASSSGLLEPKPNPYAWYMPERNNPLHVYI